jgi:hypothetical protein
MANYGVAIPQYISRKHLRVALWSLLYLFLFQWGAHDFDGLRCLSKEVRAQPELKPIHPFKFFSFMFCFHFAFPKKMMI